ncbi:MAG: 16S rRNA (cytosine(1402)-N(4))-methyltransferase RsmH [Candidatus Puniceispirillales bacterium]
MSFHPEHNPVLVVEVVEALSPKADAVYLDATFGRGGYSRAILDAAPCEVIAIDRDPDAIAAGQSLCREYDDRLTLLEGRFSQIRSLLASINVPYVDGIVFDFGVSSPQLDDADRGFSFRFDGPLDMRMEKSGTDASDFINTASEKDIADILWQFGEERASRRIARAIIDAREETGITTTFQLAKIIRAVMPRPKPGQIDPATRSFQAIRIYINNELEEIRAALPAAMASLKPGGKLAVVAFHSLEDRLVKTFIMNEAGKAPRPSRHLPDLEEHPPRLKMITRKPIIPSDDEMHRNPRSRSARLRIAERTDAPLLDEVA